jgi:hypothetical protein
MGSKNLFLSVSFTALLVGMSGCNSSSNEPALVPLQSVNKTQSTSAKQPQNANSSSPTPAPSVQVQNFQNQKIDCYEVKPTCRAMFSSEPGNENYNLNMASLDKEVNVSVTMNYITDHTTSTMQITLTDTQTGRTASQSYQIHDSEAVIGSVEDFKDKDGTLHTVLCTGAHVATGVDTIMNPPASCDGQLSN